MRKALQIRNTVVSHDKTENWTLSNTTYPLFPETLITKI